MTTAHPTPDDIRTALAAFIRSIASVPTDDPHFCRQADLFDSGYIDSLGIVVVTTYIEQHFDVTLAEADLFDPRFTTIDGMADIIAARKRASNR